MLKSMTGYSKIEISKDGIIAVVEIKTLNSRYLDINCKLPRSLQNKELEIRDIVKSNLSRGNIGIFVGLEYEDPSKYFYIDENAAVECFRTLNNLKSKLKIREQVKLENILTLADRFFQKEDKSNAELEWKIIRQAIRDSLKNVEKMRIREGQQIYKDIENRIKNILRHVVQIESLGNIRVPLERERLRQRIAQLFEMDEVDEHRIQMEILIVANKLDISEECVRLNSHIKFMQELLKSKEPAGQKCNFILQEMNREINTIGSKADDAEISQIVVRVKEELERIREQIQNVE